MLRALLLLIALAAAAPAAALPRVDYRAANAALGAPAPGENRVVFIGDSITYGWAGANGGDWFASHRYIGRGIAGETSAGVRKRFDRDALDLRPALVHILVGTNDIAGNGGDVSEDATVANIVAMADAARARGVRVLVGAVLPAADFAWRPGRAPAAKIVALNARLRAAAGAHGYRFVDYHTPLAGPDGGMRPGLSSDGVHPTADGYRAMARIADVAIAGAR